MRLKKKRSMHSCLILPKKLALNNCPTWRIFTLLNLTQLLQVPHIDNGLRFDISPDENRIVFSWNKTGTWELWELKNSGVRELAPVDQTASCLTPEVTGAKFSPRFSPDGSFLAYALDPDGSESYHIFIHSFQTNTSTDLTPDIAYAH